MVLWHLHQCHQVSSVVSCMTLCISILYLNLGNTNRNVKTLRVGLIREGPTPTLRKCLALVYKHGYIGDVASCFQPIMEGLFVLFFI